MKWIKTFLKPSRRLFTVALMCTLLVPGATPGAASVHAVVVDVLSSLAGKGVEPSLTQAADTARELDVSARRLCENRDSASLEQARKAWREAYLAWRRAAPFMFGSADKLKRRIAYWPVNDVVLKAAAESAEFRHLRNQPDVRGYAAAEYLLFVPGDAAGATGGECCAHLLDVTGEIADLTARAKEAWDRRLGNEFRSAGDGKPFLVPDDALSFAFAEILNVTERMLRDDIGAPSGFFVKEDVRPNRLEAWRSGTSQEAFLATVKGLRLAIIGDGEPSIANLVATRDGLVSTKDPGLAADMQRQFDKLEKTIFDLGGRDIALYTELKDNPTRLESLYTQMQKLQEQLMEASLVLELDVGTTDEKSTP